MCTNRGIICCHFCFYDNFITIIVLQILLLILSVFLNVSIVKLEDFGRYYYYYYCVYIVGVLTDMTDRHTDIHTVTQARRGRRPQPLLVSE